MNRKTQRIRFGLLSFSLVIAVILSGSVGGCGTAEPGVSVHGKISFNGKPVTSGLVNFISDGSPFGCGIQSDGTFTCSLPPGDYRVIVVPSIKAPAGWKDGDPMPEVVAAIPPKYSQPSTSGLTVSIDPTQDSVAVDFALEGSVQPQR